MTIMPKINRERRKKMRKLAFWALKITGPRPLGGGARRASDNIGTKIGLLNRKQS